MSVLDLVEPLFVPPAQQWYLLGHVLHVSKPTGVSVFRRKGIRTFGDVKSNSGYVRDHYERYIVCRFVIFFFFISNFYIFFLVYV